MSHLYDYAWAQIPAPAMASVPGCVGVMRYVNDTKALTQPEIANLHAAKLGIGLVFEAAALDLEHPERAAGIAKQANDLADALGAPRNVPLFFCHDSNDTATGSVAQSYSVLAVASVRPAGLYGSAADLDSCKPVYGWQVETWAPKGYVSPYAHMVQLANTKKPLIPGVDQGQYDTNILYHPLPLWGGAAPIALNGSGGMYFGYVENNGAVRAYAIDGDVLVTELGGGPGAFGLPADAVKYHTEQGIPLFPITQAIVDRATAKAAPAAAAQNVSVDTAAVAAAVLAELTNHPLVPKA